jgi:hypothetical protein
MRTVGGPGVRLRKRGQKTPRNNKAAPTGRGPRITSRGGRDIDREAAQAELSEVVVHAHAGHAVGQPEAVVHAELSRTVG